MLKLLHLALDLLPRHCCEWVYGLCYNLTWRIPIDLSIYVFGDNKSALAHNSVQHPVLKKKSSSITCHSVSEQIAYMLGAKLNWVLIWTLLIWIQSLCLEGRDACVSKILSIVLHGMISSRGVQYLYYLPRFCWQYFFQGGVDNIIWIRHPTLLNHRFNHLPMKGEFPFERVYISSLQVNYWHICLEGSVSVITDIWCTCMYVRRTSQNCGRTNPQNDRTNNICCTYLFVLNTISVCTKASYWDPSPNILQKRGEMFFRTSLLQQ